MYDNGANCGKKAKVTRKDDPSKTVTVVSACRIGGRRARENAHTLVDLLTISNFSPLTLLFSLYITQRLLQINVQVLVMFSFSEVGGTAKDSLTSES